MGGNDRVSLEPKWAPVLRRDLARLRAVPVAEGARVGKRPTDRTCLLMLAT